MIVVMSDHLIQIEGLNSCSFFDRHLDPQWVVIFHSRTFVSDIIGTSCEGSGDFER